ncbi:MAG: NADH-quinone oxidoreductase subunit L [Candidatus Omnitrophica bacterium]|nr:NADH-quinone oxidoreductase subunit L [Candidatus Omnitrophota bacterium]
MTNKILLLSCVFIPLAGAIIAPLAGYISTKFRNALALAAISASFIAAASLIPVVLAGNTITVSANLPLGFNFILTADCLAVFMATVSSFICAIIVLYSFGYISHYRNQNEYYLMVVLFLGSMMGLVFSANLIFLYIFWEITAIASWRLIGFFREKRDILRADKAFLVTVFGALAMLLAFVLIYQKVGSFDLAAIKLYFKTTPVPDIAVILILLGILTKSATLPFHTWLPDAGVAPSPVTALLHAAVLVKIGVYVFARLFIVTFTPSEIWHTIIPALAAASALVSAGAALVETDLKRIIAYSTVSQIGFIFLGFAVNNTIGIAGAMLFILMHGLAKGGLFLCAGIVEQNTKTKDITRMGGLISTMPITALSFLACSFSIMGIPPFGGFFSKYMVFSGAVGGGNIYITLAFLSGAVLTILYLFRLFNMVFLGESRGNLAKEGSATMIVSVAVLATMSLAGGIYIIYPSSFVAVAVKQMVGM